MLVSNYSFFSPKMTGRFSSLDKHTFSQVIIDIYRHFISEYRKLNSKLYYRFSRKKVISSCEGSSNTILASPFTGEVYR